MKRMNLLILSILLFSFSVLFAKDTVDVKNKETAQLEVSEAKLFIEVSEVSKRSVETLLLLKEITENTQKSEEIIDIHDSLKTFIPALDEMLKQDTYKNVDGLSVKVLQQMQSDLLIYRDKLKQWNLLLDSNVKIYVDNLKKLEDESLVWAETSLNAKKNKAPKTIQESIASVIAKINELENKTKKDYDILLTDSSNITTNSVKIKDILESLKKTEAIASNQIFRQNQLPLFALLEAEDFAIDKFVFSAYKNIQENIDELSHYFETHENLVYKFYFISLLLALFIFYFYRLYRQKKLFVQEDSYKNKDFFFIRTPFATYFILLSLSIVIIFVDRPSSLVDFLLLLLAIPTFRTLSVFIDTNSKKYLYMFFGLFVLFLVNKNSMDYELDSRVLNLIVNMGLMYFFIRVLRDKILDFILNDFIKQFAYKVAYLFVFLIFLAIGANIYGGVLFEARIIAGIFITSITALIFYAIHIILTGYILLLLRRRIATAHLVAVYSQNLENTLIKIVKVIMFIWWTVIVLKALSLYPFIINIKDTVLSLSWSIANTTISVASIVDFVFIMVGTWAFATILNIVLKVEIFARFRFPRGIPTAITTVLNYMIIITGGIIALSSLGVTPEQFTLVFGALGVGIGFGLRNIIANFISGLIMVFERPIQIGDTIEMNKTFGSVQSIGARSSTIKTFDGSEVIIPNADFIAKEITNWTLSDQRRRKLVVFKVDSESDVEVVLKIMKDVALDHKDVLSDPEPLAAFEGFGDNYFEFKLYIWLTDNLVVAHSEVSMNIYKELKKAGIKMPVPKQETLLKSIDKEDNT